MKKNCFLCKFFKNMRKTYNEKAAVDWKNGNGEQQDFNENSRNRRPWKMYNFRTRAKRAELLDKPDDDPSDCEVQSDPGSEQNLSDVGDSDSSFFDEDDLQDAIETERASTSRKRPAGKNLTGAAPEKSGKRGRPCSKLYGKNKFAWETRIVERRSDRITIDAVPYEASLADEAVNLNSLEEFWDLLLNREIIDIIVQNTNAKIEEVCAPLIAEGRAQTYHHHTDALEIRAYIGVLYYAGLWKSSHVDNNELWDKKNGIYFYRGVFPRMRFEFLQSCLRFDTRENRDPDDRFSPIRMIWSIFNNNCSKYYNPSSQCTVDGQLLGFRGRCVFRMYIKSKPDKYGLKLITLNDASTAYLINAIPYLGKNMALDNPEKIPSGEYFFQAVTAPIHGTNRSVTCDNWFTTIPLLNRMLKDPFKMFLTGTIRKNKREIPLEMKVTSKNPPETKFCHTKQITLLSYTPKKNKIVLVASTYLHTREITDGKPNIILHYNDTKGGTDTFDQLCHAYTVSRRTNRWPMRIFFGMLDQAAVNAHILWKLKAGDTPESTTAITVLKKLIDHLTVPMLQKRLTEPCLRKELRMVITGLLKIDNEPYLDHLRKVYFEPPRRCMECTRNRDKKSRYGCWACEKVLCDDHRITLCPSCVGQ
ncbi:piggyBac transposable element-derived protein 4-like [Diachasma alloeum]|uniref:piggyBac transposable element-derived protein 4-like n=1 Tax=Diachasma alloeum TaxID=454923 RepID=UPI00073812D5|nr:piggyBac transposable element-derived protein 4-like [Diachasma alloeum]